MGFVFFKSHLLHDEKAYKKSLLEKERLERNLYKATTWDVFMYIERERGVWDLRCRDAQGNNFIIIQQDVNDGSYGSIYLTHPIMLDCFSSLEFVLDEF